MERWAGKVALVTGASQGIGKAIVKRLINNGMKVVACARNEENLKALRDDVYNQCPAGACIEIIHCDVSDESQVLWMFKIIKEKFGGLSVCINNAGTAIAAPILCGKTKDWKTMLDLNVLGLLIVTREAVSAMKMLPAQEGYIINISSLSGHVVFDDKNESVYAGTKFAVTAISEATRQELLHEQGTNIRVSQVFPGLVDTPLLVKHAGLESRDNLRSKIKMLMPDDIAQIVIFQLSLSPHAQAQDILVRSLYESEDLTATQ